MSNTNEQLTATTISTTYNPRWISQVYVPDLNGDGNSDLLLLGASYPSGPDATPQPSLFAFGDGEGGFLVPSQAVFPSDALKTVHPREAVFADFNGDGDSDVFIACHGWDTSPFPGEQNKLFLSNGNGTWRDASATLPQISDFSHSATVADINGDGNLDIFVSNLYSSTATQSYVLAGSGNGKFDIASNLFPANNGKLLNAGMPTVTSSLLSDLDCDGLPDLVLGAISKSSAPVASVVAWNTDGSFIASPTTDLPFSNIFGTTREAYDIQAMDVNFDGLPDLLVTSISGYPLMGWELQVLINKGNRTFADETSKYILDPVARSGGVPTETSTDSQYWIQFLNLQDVNNDGRMDMVLDERGSTSAPLSQPVIYLHQADGSFSTLRVSDLVSGSKQWLFEYSTEYITYGDTGGFVRLGLYNSTTTAYVLKTEIDPILPTLDPSSVPVYRSGSDQNDNLKGNAGNDHLIGNAGDDAIDGNSGLDSAMFSRNHSSYSLTKIGNSYTVHANVGTDGTDTLINIERLKFTDGTLALDTGKWATAGEAYRLYQAAFDRTPDTNGLAYWISVMDGGQAHEQVAHNFIVSAEFQVLYGADPSNGELITAMYKNVLDRSPDQGGYDYWLGLLNQGQITPEQLLINFSESAENVTLVGMAIEHGIWLGG